MAMAAVIMLVIICLHFFRFVVERSDMKFHICMQRLEQEPQTPDATVKAKRRIEESSHTDKCATPSHSVHGMLSLAN